MHRTVIIFASLVLTVSAAGPLAADDALSLVERHLQAGTLSDGEKALETFLKQNSRDDQARFALGAVQFVRSVEGLAQSLYRHGFMRQFANLGGPLGIEVPVNPDPQRLSYDGARKIVQSFVSNLSKTESTLAKIESADVKLPLHFGLIRLDLDGDGKADEEETLWRLYARVNRQAQVDAQDAKAFVIAFDAADVAWLRGYCHLLAAFGEALLAHDWRELFERAGQVLFADIETPYAFLAGPDKDAEPFSFAKIADLIAYIHLINFKVAEPKRMQAALAHLEAMVALSRRSWESIVKETDDDHEWIPSPKQSGVIPNVRITAEMVASWQSFLDEAAAILKGDKLVPFWRGDGELGLNLRNVFAEPKPFDLVLWVQGTGAAPFLEQGNLTDFGVWQRLLRVFQGEFIGFALWFN